MPLKGPDGQTFESFEACVTDLQDDETTREEAQRICGSFEEVDKVNHAEKSKVEILGSMAKWLYGDYGQDNVDSDSVRKGATLAGLIREGIHVATSTQESMDDIKQKIADTADTSFQSVQNVLDNEVKCPDQSIINAAARVLPVDKKALILAGRADGCEYSLTKELSDEENDVIKKNDEKQIVTGIVLKANQTDLDGDYFPADVVEESAYQFMKEFQTVGDVHEFKVDDAHVVESYIAPTDFELNGYEIEKGDWVMSTKVEDDEMWKAIKEGKRNAYSVGGTAEKVPVEDDE